MTKQSDELKEIVKSAKELDAKTSARVLVVVADIMEQFEERILEFQQAARETNVNVQKSFIETRETIQSLRTELAEYRLERNTSELKEKAMAFEIAKGRSTLSTQERMEVDKAVQMAMSRDKIDIRGIKISTRQFGYILIGVVLLLAMSIIFLPDAISQILIRLGSMIGGAP